MALEDPEKNIGQGTGEFKNPALESALDAWQKAQEKTATTDEPKPQVEIPKPQGVMPSETEIPPSPPSVPEATQEPLPPPPPPPEAPKEPLLGGEPKVATDEKPPDQTQIKSETPPTSAEQPVESMITKSVVKEIAEALGKQAGDWLEKQVDKLLNKGEAWVNKVLFNIKLKTADKLEFIKKTEDQNNLINTKRKEIQKCQAAIEAGERRKSLIVAGTQRKIAEFNAHIASIQNDALRAQFEKNRDLAISTQVSDATAIDTEIKANQDLIAQKIASIESFRKNIDETESNFTSKINTAINEVKKRYDYDNFRATETHFTYELKIVQDQKAGSRTVLDEYERYYRQLDEPFRSEAEEERNKLTEHLAELDLYHRYIENRRNEIRSYLAPADEEIKKWNDFKNSLIQPSPPPIPQTEAKIESKIEKKEESKETPKEVPKPPEPKVETSPAEQVPEAKVGEKKPEPEKKETEKVEKPTEPTEDRQEQIRKVPVMPEPRVERMPSTVKGVMALVQDRLSALDEILRKTPLEEPLESQIDEIEQALETATNAPLEKNDKEKLFQFIEDIEESRLMRTTAEAKASLYQSLQKMRDFGRVSERMENKDVIKPEQKTSQGQEKGPRTEGQIIGEFFSFQDNMDFTDEIREKILNDYLTNETAVTYSKSLVEQFGLHGENQVRELVKKLTDECKSMVERCGITGRSQYKSPSWAYWDLAKQYYYFTHQDESSPEYSLADPFLSTEKQKEMVDRQLGFEIFQNTDASYLEKFTSNPNYAELADFISNVKPKEDGSLASHNYAKLGSLMRKVLET